MRPHLPTMLALFAIGAALTSCALNSTSSTDNSTTALAEPSAASLPASPTTGSVSAALPTTLAGPAPGVTGLSTIAQYPWTPDTGRGSYSNPILFSDYSDPDVCRVGSDYYLTASSFSCLPGLPILHSKDLVNWTIIGYAIQHFPAEIADKFKYPNHGNGVWAPAIRFHNGEFYIYYGDPDNGIFMTKSKNPAGPWEPLHCVAKTLGWIDTCPFWDDEGGDGNAYLVHAFANSRARVSNLLWLNKMAPDGKSLLDDGHLIFDARGKYTTVEGPKMYKRNGYYYVLAPGGGVGPGYQIAFRSKTIYGPYESRVVLATGRTNFNGPHQGGWVDSPDGKENWFMHFQEVLPYGRIVHLQPVIWQNDWPIMGDPIRGQSFGQPVTTHRKPLTPPAAATEATTEPDAIEPIAPTAIATRLIPQTTDEFNSPTLGLQWQWWADWKDTWYSLTANPGSLRLYAVSLDKPQPLPIPLYDRPNLLLQKFPAEAFTVTTKLNIASLGQGNRAGLVLAGRTTASLSLEFDAPTNTTKIIRTNFIIRAAASQPATQPGPGGGQPGAGRGRGQGRGRGPAGSQPATRPQKRFDEPPYGPIPKITLIPDPALTQPAPGVRPGDPATRPAPLPRETEDAAATIPGSVVYLRLTVAPKGYSTFSYSTDGQAFAPLGKPITANNDTWIGAKVGLFCSAPATSPPAATGAAITTRPEFIDADWFHFE